MKKEAPLTFMISLSVLDHLGRKLYRNFATILGEAISNSWDADAEDVRIYINKEKTGFFIKDNGIGMNHSDFQTKFLNVGYSKRIAESKSTSKNGRPFIGRKGIGKLALLSCAEKIHILSKVEGGNYVGGIIDNSSLDDAITENINPQQYPLGKLQADIFEELLKDFEKGTIIYFEGIKEGIKNRLKFLRKVIALYFRFSLLDPSFSIFLDDEEITLDDLNDLSQNTEFLWNINNLQDKYIKEKLVNLKEQEKQIVMEKEIVGFIASVKRPRDLNIYSTSERIGVDLFVNGRLREKNILKHIPTATIPEDYLYGQIHFNDLDDSEDRFASGREGVIADDPKYNNFLEKLREKILEIVKDWDKFRRKNRETGDEENKSVPPEKRKSEELFNIISKDFEISEDPEEPENKKKVDGWFGDLSDDASYNLPSYTECFISENLIRKHIHEKNISLTSDEEEIIRKFREKESDNKARGNISINLRQQNSDLSYLDMKPLAELVDPQRGHANGLATDAKQYKSIRDALMHTALLTEEAKEKLTTIRENIKARVKNLLSDN